MEISIKEFLSLAGNTSNDSSCLSANDIPDRFKNSCVLARDVEGVIDAVAGVRIVTSALGMLGACSIIVSSLIRCRVAKSDVHPIFMVSLADCMLAALWIAGSVMWYTGPDAYRNVWCYAVTLITSILECVAINLTLVYAFLAYIRIKRTKLDDLLNVQQHIPDIHCCWSMLLYLIAWTLPLFMIMILFGVMAGSFALLKGTDACTCWCLPNVINILPYAVRVDHDRDKFISKQRSFTIGVLALLIINYVVVFMMLLVLYAKILLKVQALRNEFVQRAYGTTVNFGVKRVSSRQSKARKRVVMFVGVFLLSGFCNIVLIVWYLVLLTSESIRQPPIRGHKRFDDIVSGTFAPMFAQSLTLPLQGLLNAIVYGWTREDFVQGIANPNTSEEENVTLTLGNQEHYQPKDTVTRRIQLVSLKKSRPLQRRITHLSDTEASLDRYLTSASEDDELR